MDQPTVIRVVKKIFSKTSGLKLSEDQIFILSETNFPPMPGHQSSVRDSPLRGFQRYMIGVTATKNAKKEIYAKNFIDIVSTLVTSLLPGPGGGAANITPALDLTGKLAGAAVGTGGALDQAFRDGVTLANTPKPLSEGRENQYDGNRKRFSNLGSMNTLCKLCKIDTDSANYVQFHSFDDFRNFAHWIATANKDRDFVRSFNFYHFDNTASPPVLLIEGHRASLWR